MEELFEKILALKKEGERVIVGKGVVIFENLAGGVEIYDVNKDGLLFLAGGRRREDGTLDITCVPPA